MQALKGLVIVMGLAILAILGVIIYTVAGRVAESPVAAAGVGFGTTEVRLPESCRLAGSDSGEGRLFLRLDGPAASGCQQVIVLDLESGRELGRITAKQQP